MQMPVLPAFAATYDLTTKEGIDACIADPNCFVCTTNNVGMAEAEAAKERPNLQSIVQQCTLQTQWDYTYPGDGACDTNTYQGFTYVNGKTFAVTKANVTWGAYKDKLAIIRNQEENDAVYNMVKNLSSPYGTFWIGLYDPNNTTPLNVRNPDRFYWRDGTPSSGTYTNWCSVMPDNACGPESHAEIAVSQPAGWGCSRPGQWNDRGAACGTHQPAVVEFPGRLTCVGGGTQKHWLCPIPAQKAACTTPPPKTINYTVQVPYQERVSYQEQEFYTYQVWEEWCPDERRKIVCTNASCSQVGTFCLINSNPKDYFLPYWHQADQSQFSHSVKINGKVYAITKNTFRYWDGPKNKAVIRDAADNEAIRQLLVQADAHNTSTNGQNEGGAWIGCSTNSGSRWSCSDINNFRWRATDVDWLTIANHRYDDVEWYYVKNKEAGENEWLSHGRKVQDGYNNWRPGEPTDCYNGWEQACEIMQADGKWVGHWQDLYHKVIVEFQDNGRYVDKTGSRWVTKYRDEWRYRNEARTRLEYQYSYTCPLGNFPCVGTTYGTNYECSNTPCEIGKNAMVAEEDPNAPEEAMQDPTPETCADPNNIVLFPGQYLTCRRKSNQNLASLNCCDISIKDATQKEEILKGTAAYFSFWAAPGISTIGWAIGSNQMQQYAKDFANWAMGGTCTDSEQKLGVLKSVGDNNGNCEYMGDWCSNYIGSCKSMKVWGKWIKVPVPAAGCERPAESYCCYPNGLEKAIARAARAQLGIGWGTQPKGVGTNPCSPDYKKFNVDCRGITLSEFMKLNLDTASFNADIKQYIDSMIKDVTGPGGSIEQFMNDQEALVGRMVNQYSNQNKPK